MEWRVKIEQDLMTGGDLVAVAVPTEAGGPGKVVEWKADAEGGRVRGRVVLYPAEAVFPDSTLLHMPEGVLDAICASRCPAPRPVPTPTPASDRRPHELVVELRAQLAIERARVDRALDAGLALPYAQPPERELCGATRNFGPHGDTEVSCELPAGHRGGGHATADTWWSA